MKAMVLTPQGRYLPAVVFLVGLVTGLIITSLISNYTAVSHHLVYPSILQSPMGRELVALVQRYNKSLAKHAQRLGDISAHDAVNRADQLINHQVPFAFDDQHYHNEDGGMAQNLRGKVRILCWVMTMESNHPTKTVAVNNTWAKHCDKTLLMSDAEDPALNTIKIKTQPGRGHLNAKTMKAFDYIFISEMNAYDWFLKADDDTYVVVENLRFLLKDYSHDDPVYFGLNFYPKRGMRKPYFSGGAGYVISREALRRYGRRQEGACVNDGPMEDVQMGQCMAALGVRQGDSRDAFGRQRFNCFRPVTYFQNSIPMWFYHFSKYPVKLGMSSMSDMVISFHYLRPEEMYEIEFFIYHFKRSGVLRGSSLWGTRETPAKELLRLLVWYAVSDQFREDRA